jgi:hypothetical protein
MYCILRREVLHWKSSGEKECEDELFVREKTIEHVALEVREYLEVGL